MKVNFYLCVVFAILMCATCFAATEDFSWSWEDGESATRKPAADNQALISSEVQEKNTAANTNISELTDVLSGFNEEDVTEPSKVEEDVTELPKVKKEKSVEKVEEQIEEETLSDNTATAKGVVNVDAYNELLKSNLELRNQINEITQNKDQVKKENDRLSGEIKDMENRVSQLVQKIQELGAEKASSSGDTEKVAQLESSLANAKSEKDLLTRELDELKAKSSGSATSTPAGQQDGTVKPGSDLFKQVQKENADLKKELSAAMEGQAKARQVLDSQKDLEKKLEESKTVEKDHKRVINDLLKQIPRLEGELVATKSAASEKDFVLNKTAKELEEVRKEMERRDYRLVKAEKMSDLIEKTRGEVMMATDMEMRDMHYNMGTVYTKEGKYKESEREYLSALRIDPSDAESHYNLGVLYDDYLNDKQNAVRHYKAYLKLRPNANDVNMVKEWLMRLEIK